ncbi:MAG: type transport system ATP-binding protein [Thermoanaerobacteraceae bacterium]|jgi:ABC-2 type transport system ATP-binding protein|nr:type transport system ATP-binding protein [Thermoanaerobacteraceae bacterium]MDN5312911.1 type transport system ATP-binding protein [Thermoanaerobacteraceae bacterium]RKL61472.1 ABC transporter ATP-binding protein [Thermoanaerobacteraceae bacterium SP2]
MVIETFDLTKQYNGRGGCIDIRLQVGEGEVFGFLGPNGAGKSTLVKTLVGLLFPTSGSAKILGRPLGDTGVKAKIGYLPENFKYHDWMTGWEVLKFHVELYKLKDPKKRIEELLELVKLSGHEKKRVSGYSKGMQQRLGLAVALLPDPDLLFLDEPTSALDPVGRIEVREIIKDMKSRGKTVFLNSHLLSEVEMICDEVAIINRGRIITQGKLSSLLESGTSMEARISKPSKDLVKDLSGRATQMEIDGNILRFKVKDRQDIPEIVKAIVNSGTLLYELKPVNGSLEEFFVNLLKEGK